MARGSVTLPAEGSWPEFNKMIGGYFKYHWNDGTTIPVKIDDPKSPIDKAFAGKGFEIVDETYTFAQDSFSRENVHVLKSVDYDKMPPETKDDGAGRHRAHRWRLRAELHPPRGSRAACSTKPTATTSGSTRCRTCSSTFWRGFSTRWAI